MFAVSKYDIRQLRVFATVVEHGGVSSAANKLGVSLSTVSRDLSALEERIGVHLCRRGRGGFALTPQGEHIYQATVDLLSRLHGFEQEVQAARESVSGVFNLGVIDNVISNPAAGIVDALSKMHRDYPEMLVNVSVHESPTVDILVREHRLDIGTTGTPAWLPQIQYVPAFAEEHRPFVSRKSPYYDRIVDGLGGKPVGDIPYIARGFRADTFRGFEESFPLQIAGRGATLESILAAVLAGVGFALLPTHFVETVRRSDLVEIPLDAPPVRVQFYLAYHGELASHPAIKAFMDRFHGTIAGDDPFAIAQA